MATVPSDMLQQLQRDVAVLSRKLDAMHPTSRIQSCALVILVVMVMAAIGLYAYRRWGATEETPYAAEPDVIPAYTKSRPKDPNYTPLPAALAAAAS